MWDLTLILIYNIARNISLKGLANRENQKTVLLEQLTNCFQQGVNQISWRNPENNSINLSNLHLLGFSNTAMRMDVSDVYWSVSFVAADTPAYPHPQGLPGILADVHDLLRQLGSLYPENFFKELRHLCIGLVIEP